ncbi:MAG: hypothetical protein WC135_01385 [Bacteroidales bacterium]
MKLKLSTKILFATGALILLASIVFTIYIGTTDAPFGNSNMKIYFNEEGFENATTTATY